MPDDLEGLDEAFLRALYPPQEPDEFLLEAIYEVDALTPSVPAIAPKRKNPVTLDIGQSRVQSYLLRFGCRYDRVTDEIVKTDGRRIPCEKIKACDFYSLDSLRDL